MFQVYYPPGFVGCYPATVTIEQIRTGNRNTVQRSIPRWTAYAALEEEHGLHLLPDEPRAYAYGLAVSTECSLHHDLKQQCKGEEPGQRPVDLAIYLPVLSAYLSEARLSFLLSDIHRIAQEAADRRLTFIDKLIVRRKGEGLDL